MANRIKRMRTALRENLEKLGSPLNWEHITNQVCVCIPGHYLVLSSLKLGWHGFKSEIYDWLSSTCKSTDVAFCRLECFASLA